jgi:hypothetical protein
VGVPDISAQGTSAGATAPISNGRPCDDARRPKRYPSGSAKYLATMVMGWTATLASDGATTRIGGGAGRAKSLLLMTPVTLEVLPHLHRGRP